MATLGSIITNGAVLIFWRKSEGNRSINRTGGSQRRRRKGQEKHTQVEWDRGTRRAQDGTLGSYDIESRLMSRPWASGVG